MYKLTITSTGETPYATLDRMSYAIEHTERLFYAGAEEWDDETFRLERRIKTATGVIIVKIEPIEESAFE